MINIVRDNGPPHFTQQPYVTTTTRDVTVNSTVILALAVDNDLQGEIMYKLVGNYPAPTFFKIDSHTGAVQVIRSVELDSLQTKTYYVSVLILLWLYTELISQLLGLCDPSTYQSYVSERVVDLHLPWLKLILRGEPTTYQSYSR